MKLDGQVDRSKGPEDIAGFFCLTSERSNEIQKFVDGLFERVEGEGINKVEVIEKVIEFANTTIEAVLIYGWFESRYAAETIPQQLLLNKLEGLFEKK